MKIKIEKLVLILCILFWPISLFTANTALDFLKYLIPSVLVGTSFLLREKKLGFYQIPILLIPLIEPKFAVFPLIVFILLFLWEKEKKHLAVILISILILALTWKDFLGQTIFQPDYEAQQEIIGKSYLYPNIITARIFQNKPRIYVNKFNNNLLALTDPSNYFFNFHPREIKIDNQNLNKYPFMSLVFMLFGLYHLKKNPHWEFILILLVAGFLSLSVLKIFDRNDFILWIPITLIIIHGIANFRLKQKRILKVFYAIFLTFTAIQLIRILINM